MLNLIQHLTKPRTNKTLKQVQGDKKDFLRDRQHLRLLLQLHRLTAAVEGSIPAFGHNKLCTAFLAHISFADLIRHVLDLLFNHHPPSPTPSPIKGEGIGRI